MSNTEPTRNQDLTQEEKAYLRREQEVEANEQRNDVLHDKFERALNDAFTDLNVATKAAYKRLEDAGFPEGKLYYLRDVEERRVVYDLGQYESKKQPTLWGTTITHSLHGWIDSEGSLYFDSWNILQTRSQRSVDAYRYELFTKLKDDRWKGYLEEDDFIYDLSRIRKLTRLCNRFHRESWLKRLMKRLHS